MPSSFQVLKIDSTTPVDPYLWDAIRPLVEATEDLYPGIDLWLRRRIKPGLRDGSRLCYVVIQDELPKAIAILKRGVNAKLCTLRVAPEAVGRHFGSVLMLLIAHELLQTSKQAHFTIPESVWYSHSLFYEDFGFEMKGYAYESYRRGDREFVCQASRADILRACLGKVLTLCPPRFSARLEARPSNVESLEDRLSRLSAKIASIERDPSIAIPDYLPAGLTSWYKYLAAAEASSRIPVSHSPEDTEDNWMLMPVTKALLDRQECGASEQECYPGSSHSDGPIMTGGGANPRFQPEILSGLHNNRALLDRLLASLSDVLQTIHSGSI